MKLKSFKTNINHSQFKPKIPNGLQKFFSFSENDDVTITNIVPLNEKIMHLTIHLDDIYYTGTKSNGISIEFPFTQTINVFIASNIIFIEDKGHGYTEKVKKFLNHKYNFMFDNLVLQNDFFVNMKNKLNIQIQNIYFVDSFGDKLGEIELLNEYSIDELPNHMVIDYLTCQPLKFSDSFITISHNGDMTLSFQSIESFEKWLLFIIEELGYV